MYLLRSISLKNKFLLLLLIVNLLTISLVGWRTYVAAREEAISAWDTSISGHARSVVKAGLKDLRRKDYSSFVNLLRSIPGFQGAAFYNKTNELIYTNLWDSFPPSHNSNTKFISVEVVDVLADTKQLLLLTDRSINPWLTGILYAGIWIILAIVGMQICLWLLWKRFFYEPLLVAFEKVLEGGEIEKVAPELDDFSKKVVEALKTSIARRDAVEEAKRQKILYDKAKRAVHDILSPLQTLRLNYLGMSHDHRIDLILRAENIAKDLLPEKKQVGSTSAFNPLVAVNKCITELSAPFDISVSQYGSYIPDGHVSEHVFLRVVRNLLNNSVEAKSVSSVKVLIHQSSDHLTVEILNDGELPSKNQLAKLNAGHSFTTKAAGSGLGVASVRDLLESIGGSLTYVVDGFFVKASATFTSLPDLPVVCVPSWVEVIVVGNETQLPPIFLEILHLNKIKHTCFVTIAEAEVYCVQTKMIPKMIIADAESLELKPLLQFMDDMRMFPRYLVSPKSFTQVDLASKNAMCVVSAEHLTKCEVHVIENVVVLEDEKYVSAQWRKLFGPKQLVVTDSEPDLSCYDPKSTLVFIDHWIGDENSLAWTNSLRSAGFRHLVSTSAFETDFAHYMAHVGKSVPWRV